MGWNSRLDAIQAAVLRIKLRHLDAENQIRRKHARRYDSGLGNISEIRLPQTTRDCRHVHHVHHIYAIRVRKRQMVMEELAGKGIACAIHYPVPVHLQPAFSDLGYQRGDFPVSECCAEEFVSLPMFPELTPRQIDSVVEAVGEALGVFAAV